MVAHDDAGRAGTRGTALPRLGVFGSCVTRDAFGRRPEARGCTIPVYIARSSVISVVAEPVAYDPGGLEGIGGFERRCIETDFDKTALTRLAEAELDWLIIDLIDERFDLLRSIDGGLVTRSLALRERSPLERDPALGLVPIGRGLAAVHAFWESACTTFCRRLSRIIPQERIIVHRAYWTDRVRTPDGAETDEALTAQCALSNAYLARYYDRLLQEMPACRVIDVDPAHRVADRAHQWGPAPYHYVPEYYADFRDRLTAVLAGQAGKTATAGILVESPEAAPAALADLALDPAATAALLALGLGGEATADRPLAEPEVRAALGDADALLALGHRRRAAHGDGRNDLQAFDALVGAALHGSTEACLAVADAYLVGSGVARNVAMAVRWLRSAVATSPEARYRLACMYETGFGVPRRPEVARAMFRQAAESGHAAAAYRHGLMLEAGLGGGMDRARAEASFLLAARLGHVEAQARLDRMRSAATPLTAAAA